MDFSKEAAELLTKGVYPDEDCCVADLAKAYLKLISYIEDIARTSVCVDESPSRSILLAKEASLVFSTGSQPAEKK